MRTCAVKRLPPSGGCSDGVTLHMIMVTLTISLHEHDDDDHGDHAHEERFAFCQHGHGVSMSDDRLFASIEAMQERERERERRLTPPRVSAFLHAPSTVSQLDHWIHRIRESVSDPGLSEHIVLKIARALTEGRIPEGEIARVLVGVKSARARGPYFVASAKRIFQQYSLSWHEEEWK